MESQVKILFVGVLLLATYSQSIVLHSSADIANEILLIKQEMSAIKQENSVMKQEYDVIKQENMQLKNSLKGNTDAFEFGDDQKRRHLHY